MKNNRIDDNYRVKGNCFNIQVRAKQWVRSPLVLPGSVVFYEQV